MNQRQYGPQFDCDNELQRSTKCSIIRLFDILADKHDNSYQNLFRAFRYLPKSDFNKLLLGDSDYLKYSYNSIIRLFNLILINYNQNPLEVVSNEQLHVLFCFAKKTFNSIRLEHEVFASQETTDNRSLIVEFLNFLKRYVFMICKQRSTNSAQNLNLYETLLFILKEFHNFLLFIGRASQFRKESLQNLQPNSNHNSRLYNLYHTTLDIWWSSIEICVIILQQTSYSFHEIVLFKISPLKSNVYFQKLPFLEQTLQIFFYDLHLLTIDNFMNFNQNCYHQSSFVCTCCWEICFMIKIYFQKQFNIQTFYDFQISIVKLFVESSKIFRIINQEIYLDNFDNFCYDLTFKNTNDADLFVLWQFLNISPLLPLDITSENRMFYSETVQVTFPDYIIKIIRSSLSKLPQSSNGTNNYESIKEESNIKLLLILVVKIYEYLPVLNLDSVILFLDYYFKRLNMNFSVLQQNSIENYAFLPKDSLDWFDKVRPIETDSLDPNIYENSFMLFLHFLKLNIIKVQKLKHCSKNVLHRLVGKIHISLQPKTLQNLQLIGIFNLFTIFLNIFITTKDLYFKKLFIEKILSSINEIVKNHLKSDTLNITFGELIIKFCFTVLLINPHETILVENGKFLDESLSFLNMLSQEFQNRDTKHYYNILKLFFVNCRDLLRNIKDPKISFIFIQTLFNKIDFSKLYQCLRTIKRTNDMFKSFEHVKIIEFLIDLIEHSCKFDSEDRKLIENRMSLFLKQDLIKNFNHNDAQVIATFGYHLSKLQINHIEVFVVEIINFSKGLSIFQLQYLCLLFEDSELCQTLKNNKNENLKEILIETWLKCLPSFFEQNSNKIWQFTKHFFRIFFNEISLHNSNNYQEMILDSFEKYLDYCKFHLDEKITKIQLFNQINILNKECAQLKQSLIPLMIISRVVKKLSTILYQIGKFDSPMVMIFESFLQRSWKNSIIPNQQNSFVSAIIQIFKGVFRLQIEGDSYLQRKVRQMTQVFLPQLVEEYSYSTLKLQFCDFYPVWIKTVESTLEKHFLTSLNLIQSKFLTEYLSEFCKLEIKNLTPLCVVLIRNLNLGEPLGTQQSYFVQQIMTSALNKIETLEQRETFIQDVVVFYMQKNFSSRPVKAFEMFRFLLGENIHKEHLLLFHDICSSMYRFIDQTETKTISGHNTVLRNLYRDFIKHYS